MNFPVSNSNIQPFYETDSKSGKPFYNDVYHQLQKNGTAPRDNISTALFFKALPLKHYRHESVVSGKGLLDNNELNRRHMTLRQGECPGGLARDYDGPCGSTRQIHIPDNEACTFPAESCFQPQTNALRRLRGNGIIRDKQYAPPTQRPIVPYYTSTSQMLQSKSKTFHQNLFHYRRDDGSLVAAPGSRCSNRPTVYKPSNKVFAQDGGVDGSLLTYRRKMQTVYANSRNYEHAARQLVSGTDSNCGHMDGKTFPETQTCFVNKNGKLKYCPTPI